ncbi:hypothetical protein ACQKND_19340 [Viridibacillus arvi]|uniref:hypothetical protein n=1 Tax=Viridibacillus arvi TaxID=263475 RepID=UPI003D06255A
MGTSLLNKVNVEVKMRLRLEYGKGGKDAIVFNNQPCFDYSFKSPPIVIPTQNRIMMYNDKSAFFLKSAIKQQMQE